MPGEQEPPNTTPAPSMEATQPDRLILASDTVQGAEPDATTLSALPPLARPPTLPVTAAWPPTAPTFRRRETLSRQQVLLLTTLACLLIVGGLLLAIFLTVGQYHTILQLKATSDAHATANVKNTASAQSAATARVLGTQQAFIYATATALNAVTATATAQDAAATATATSFNDQLTQATSSSPTLDDSLSDTSGNHGWDQGDPTAGTGCLFTNGDYHALAGRQGYLQPCIARSTSFQNFVFQVQMTITHGNQGGLLFRADAGQNRYYIFRVGTDGAFALDVYQSSGHASTLLSGFSAAISTGLNQSNTLAVIAKNSTFNLFVNSQYLGSITDTTLSRGQIGLVAADFTLPTEAEFSSAQVWKI